MKYIIKNGMLKKYDQRKERKRGLSRNYDITVNGRDGLVRIFASFMGKVVGVLSGEKKINKDNVLGILNADDRVKLVGNMVEGAILSRFDVKRGLDADKVENFTNKIIDRWKNETA